MQRAKLQGKKTLRQQLPNRVQQNAFTAHMLLEKYQAQFCIEHLGTLQAAYVL